MSENEAAAELFLQLAEFWRPPDSVFWQEIAAGSVDEAIANLSTQAGYGAANDISREICRELLPPLSALQYFFVRCFIGIGKQSALPVESVYKKWTDDPTARLPIAGSTGYLMGDAALHARYLLDHYGFTIPPDYQMMPDHLSLLLELAAFLLRHRSDEECRLLFSQHLDWLGHFADALATMDTEGDNDWKARQVYLWNLSILQHSIDKHLQRVSVPL